MAVTREVRAPLLIATLAAAVLATAVTTVAQRSRDDDAGPGSAAIPTTEPFTPAPTTPPAAPTTEPTPTPSPTMEPTSGAAGSGTGGSDGTGGSSGEPVGGPMPGSQPKDGWPDVHGVVTDDQGRPLAGMFITTEANIADAWLRDAGDVTDVHGRFRVRCPTDAQTQPPWRGVFISVFPASGKAPASGLYDGAWQRISPDCGLADDPDVTVVLARGADIEGTLYKTDGTPDVGTHNRVGVQCDGLPHSFVNGFAPQVSFAVDPHTARFRVYGLDTDHCTLGIIEPDGTRTALSAKLALTQGKALHHDLHES